MIRSMTGFGKASFVFDTKKIQVELKALNSKQLDLNMKLPSEMRHLEYDWRSIISDKLQRGKIELSLTISSALEREGSAIDTALAAYYLKQLRQLSESLDFEPPQDIAGYLLKMPGIFAVEEETPDTELTHEIKECLLEGIEQLDQFRLKEGKVLQADLVARIGEIIKLLAEVEPLEPERLQTVKQRLLRNLNDLAANTKYDENRLEQELIYYLEKFDITEEKVRLKQHCDYFLQTLNEDNAGKKLSFIGQEIGREINTMGSKANHAAIQRLVVQMKDELEKIKEQLFNIL
ncbi:MAG: YicC family protein [Bacteroidales bacterium]|nr:YicC family protein [Bacteroidales bacterium]